MENFDLPDKEIWDRVAIIDLPYMPFKYGDKTERDVIDHLANGIIRISKSEIRRCNISAPTKKFNFELSKCIAAIDVSCIGDSQLSYIENLHYLSLIYPFVMINCVGRLDLLNQLGLHSALREKGYILPVFRRFAAFDTLVAKIRYGDNLIDLLSGKIGSISINDIKNLGSTFRIDDLISRFPGLSIQNDKVVYLPEIVWLGIDDINFQLALSYLFNNNITTFSPDELASKFGIEQIILKHYIQKGMLFAKATTHDKITFRLSKSAIIPDIMRALLDQFENEMLTRSVVDTTHSTYAEYTKGFIEYHSIGRLFEAKDTFSFKILSYAKNCFRRNDFNRIVILDNGVEDTLFTLLPKIFYNLPVARILNFYEKPILHPFDKIEVDDNILIIADLINTGEFFNNVLSYIKDKMAAKVKSVFAFIISPFFCSFKLSDGIIFNYYIEKKLNSVNEIRSSHHDKRYFAMDTNFNTKPERFNPEPFSLSYMFFWHTADKMFSVLRQPIRESAVSPSHAIGSSFFEYLYAHRFNLLKDIDFHKRPEHLLLSLIQIVDKHKIDCIVYHNDSYLSYFFRNLLNFLPKDIYIVALAEDGSLSHTTGQKSVPTSTLCVTTSMTMGNSLSALFTGTTKLFPNSQTYFAFVIFARFNASMSAPSAMVKLENVKANFSCVYYYYRSHLPFYLIHPEADLGHLHIKTLENIIEERA